MNYEIKITKAEDCWFVAEIPELPGCVSQGRTEDEARKNVKEAIAAWLWADTQRINRQ